MKKKGVSLMLLFFSIFATVNAHSASIILESHNCKVTKAGPGGNKQVLITLTDVGAAFNDITFAATKGREKEMLAVALTAMVNNMVVTISINPTSTANPPIIYDIYLITQVSHP